MSLDDGEAAARSADELRRREFMKPSSQFQGHFVLLGTGKRRHANGWVATVFKNEHELVEGYLWNEHRQPIEARREGRDVKKTQGVGRCDEESRSHLLGPVRGLDPSLGRQITSGHMEISLTGAAILLAFLAVVVRQSVRRSMTGTELRRRLKALDDGHIG